MKAIRVHQPGPPDVMKLEEIPDPLARDGQVVVEIKAVGVNPVEVYVRSGNYPLRANMPYTPGSDAAGIVRTTGPGVSHVRPGDRVYTAGTLSGSYAELALCDAAQVHALPEKITFIQGAAINVPYATAWRAIHQRAHAFAGETVLIHGASGGVGVAAVQIATAAGLTVTGTAGSEKGKRLATEQGAKHVVDHTSADYAKTLMELSNGRGFDLILEMLANVNLHKDLTLLARGGRVIVIGNRGPTQIDARQTMSKDTSIIGMSLANVTPRDLHSIHSGIIAGLGNGTLRPIINCELPLSDAPKAHELMMKSGAYGKIVLMP